jgi:acyl-CoA thioesterase
MTIVENVVSGLDDARGGAMFTLADSAFAFACSSRNQSNVALQCSISFHSVAFLSETLIATCGERARTSRTGVYDVDVSATEGRLVALFRGVPDRLSGTAV